MLESDNNNFWSSCDREYMIESVNPLILVDTTDEEKFPLENNSRLYPRWDVQKLVCETSFESDPKYWLENIAAHSILKPAEEGTDFEPFCG